MAAAHPILAGRLVIHSPAEIALHSRYFDKKIMDFTIGLAAIFAPESPEMLDFRANCLYYVALQKSLLRCSIMPTL